MATYWHLLSLDAPSVAALWSWSFARAMHISLPLLAPLLLATGTWLIYVADRLLDGLDSGNGAHLQARHHFYSRHRQFFLTAGTIVCPAFLWVVFTRMTPRVWREDAAIFTVAALYFLLIHIRGKRIERWLPKELAVGILFAAATAVPAWARLGGYRLILLPAVALFAVLCWLNCVAIDRWERTGASRAQASAHITTMWAGRHLRRLTTATAVLAILLIPTALEEPALAGLYLASAASAMLLLWLERSELRLSTMQLRIATDAALLTPLFFLWVR